MRSLTRTSPRTWRRRLAAVVGATALAAGTTLAGAPAAAATAPTSGGPQADFRAFCYDAPLIFTCSFDGRLSTGDIVSWEWVYPNQLNTGTVEDSGPQVGNVFQYPPFPGCLIDVTLTVTDASDDTDALTKVINFCKGGFQ